jgi:hypothetical protein
MLVISHLSNVSSFAQPQQYRGATLNMVVVRWLQR